MGISEKSAIEWARIHKREFVRHLIDEAGVESSENPVGIFMSGLPGSGKTEFTKSLIKILGLSVVRLDMDDIATQMERYDPKIADVFRAGASILLSREYDEVLKNKYDFVMDGTFGGKVAVENVRRALAHGYQVRIFYINQDPGLAWKYTVAREKIEFRSIDREGFISTYYKIFENLSGLNQFLGQHSVVDIIIKDKNNRVKDWIRLTTIENIDKYVKKIYNKDELRKLLYE